MGIRAGSVGFVAAVVLVLTAGCSGGGDDEAQADVADVVETTTTTAPMTTSTTLPPTPPLGTAAMYMGAAVTAHAVEQPVAVSSPAPAEAGYPADYVWVGLDVEVCVPVGEEGATVSMAPWSLAYPDGALLSPSHTGYAGFPQPAYPWGEQPVAGGQCVRGWIVFAGPAGGRPAKVQYAPLPGDTPIEWAVP